MVLLLLVRESRSRAACIPIHLCCSLLCICVGMHCSQHPAPASAAHDGSVQWCTHCPRWEPHTLDCAAGGRVLFGGEESLSTPLNNICRRNGRNALTPSPLACDAHLSTVPAGHLRGQPDNQVAALQLALAVQLQHLVPCQRATPADGGSRPTFFTVPVHLPEVGVHPVGCLQGSKGKGLLTVTCCASNMQAGLPTRK